LISSTDVWKGGFYLTIDRVICERVSYPLAKQVTTSSEAMERDMVKIAIHATHEASGKSFANIGEVSPLPKLHEESFEEAQSQVICLADMLAGSRMPLSIVSQNGSLEAWLSKIGITPSTLLPSVRFGLESALLDLVSSTFGCSALKPRDDPERNTVHVSGLLSSEEDIQSIAREAEALVARGFRGIKVKVGRANSVEKDIATVRKIREMVGPDLVIRCDANRAWSLEEALAFVEGVEDCQIEFIEEPVKHLSALKVFCESSPQIPVALDENLSDMLRNVTMDSICTETAKILRCFSGSLGAVVLKPSVLGSLERFRAIVDVCVEFGIKPIVSSTFESSVGLYNLAQLASYVDSAVARKTENTSTTPILHGLGTIDWNVLEPQEEGGRLRLERASFGSNEEASSLAIHTAKYSNKTDDWQQHTVSPTEIGNQTIKLYDSAHSSLDYGDTIHSGFMTLHRFSTNNAASKDVEVPPAVFIHGFLGAMDDWRPLMSSISNYGDSYAVSLPGHSSGTFLQVEANPNQLQNTFAFTSTSLTDLLDQSSVRKPVLIAYSMGARVALDMVLRFPEKFSGLMLISSSPGIEDKASRESRAVKDMLLSTQIRETGSLQLFLETWYQQPLFGSFKNSPHYASVVKQRAKIHTTHGLADALIGLSPGLQESLWPKLKHLAVPLCVVCGDCDSKYVEISHKMVALARKSPHLKEEDVQLHTIRGAGHCVHVETPQALAPILANFVTHIRQADTTR
jgi:isochorismate synthase/2-succinyl-5-enolpyruvyl-6-hydroxy-3-cyclohexene-1-carboxylate synthase/2-succinyl-6-hydroxy-2,4-cyclohexadiene-1-carboxylate synthase/O-succinylbenzoate synthase